MVLSKSPAVKVQKTFWTRQFKGPRVPSLPIRKVPYITGPQPQDEESLLRHFKSIPNPSARKRLKNANPCRTNSDRSRFCQTGRVPISSIRKGPYLANLEGPQKNKFLKDYLLSIWRSSKRICKNRKGLESAFFKSLYLANSKEKLKWLSRVDLFW